MLDADMLVRRNMDELFDVPLDEENRSFAATRMYLFGCYPGEVGWFI
jgi:alpha-N-acetylglucosamine transferase